MLASLLVTLGSAQGKGQTLKGNCLLLGTLGDLDHSPSRDDRWVVILLESQAPDLPEEVPGWVSRTKPNGASAEIYRLVPLPKIEHRLRENGMAFRIIRSQGDRPAPGGHGFFILAPRQVDGP